MTGATALRGAARPMSTYATKNFINGKFVDSDATEFFPLHNPVGPQHMIFRLQSPPIVFLMTLHPCAGDERAPHKRAAKHSS